MLSQPINFHQRECRPLEPGSCERRKNTFLLFVAKDLITQRTFFIIFLLKSEKYMKIVLQYFYPTIYVVYYHVKVILLPVSYFKSQIPKYLSVKRWWLVIQNNGLSAVNPPSVQIHQENDRNTHSHTLPLLPLSYLSIKKCCNLPPLESFFKRLQ